MNARKQLEDGLRTPFLSSDASFIPIPATSLEKAI